MPGILSFTAEMRDAFGKLNADQREALREDDLVMTCTNGYDNDGSTGFELFANGFEFAEKAAGRPVHGHDPESGDEDDGITFLVIGTPDEAVALFEKVAADNPSEEP